MNGGHGSEAGDDALAAPRVVSAPDLRANRTPRAMYRMKRHAATSATASIDSSPVQGPVTQSFRLRWRPELRFYDCRISLLHELQDSGLLEGFRVSEDSVDAQLPERRWLSIGPSGLTANVLATLDDASDFWARIETVCGVLAPLQFSHARVSYQHVLDLPFSFERAVALGHERLYKGLSTPEVTLDDWALLTNLKVAGPPPSEGLVEFGIVRSGEVPQRLGRLVGRGPGMLHLGQREWQASEFKDVSVYADSDLTCRAQTGQEEAFLEEAAQFWAASRAQMNRLVEGLRRKLVGES